MDTRSDPGPNHGPDPTFLEAINGALDWWRDAGVDCDFDDTPISWLAVAEEETAIEEGRTPPRARRAETAPAEPERPRIDPASIPDDLAAYAAWWLHEPLLGEGTGVPVPPRGPAGARLMVLVEEPEAQDGDTLLSGAEGQLLSAMLKAFGITPEQVYVASALPRHTPHPDWAEMAARGIGPALARHVRLVAPERLLVLGSNVLSLIGHKLPQRPAVLGSFKDEGGEIPMLASWALPALRSQPRAKAVLWQAWLEWTAG